MKFLKVLSSLIYRAHYYSPQMHHGKVWETGPTDEVFANPQTEELQSFLAAVR